MRRVGVGAVGQEMKNSSDVSTKGNSIFANPGPITGRGAKGPWQ